MTWFKGDDAFPQHPKVLAIPRRERTAAVGLWTLAGMWCSGQLTDGFVPDYMVQELSGTKKSAQLLVTVGLWEDAEGGYQFHDWLMYNPSANEVRADQRRKSEAKAKAGRAGGIASGVARRKHAPSTDEADTKQTGSETKPRPVPSRSSSKEELPFEADASPEPDFFAEFWDAYPRRTAKRAAEKAWRAAVKRADPRTIIDSLARFQFGTDPQFVAYPATWLNQDRWADEPAPIPGPAWDPNLTPLRRASGEEYQPWNP